MMKIFGQKEVTVDFQSFDLRSVELGQIFKHHVGGVELDEGNHGDLPVRSTELHAWRP